MSQLQTYYDEQVVPKLKEQFNYSNVHQIPKVEKVVLNMGLGEAIQNIKILESAVEELTLYRRSETGSDQGEKVHRRL